MMFFTFPAAKIFSIIHLSELMESQAVSAAIMKFYPLYKTHSKILDLVHQLIPAMDINHSVHRPIELIDDGELL